ncbi:MAG: hypothetical protein K5872_08930 [Rhizobiaceae bacterium]|nr:hypothetical protein [Rhizobiaceae bacterium]MCV0406339.1 hypothetical protein [Rhizobiaceae bacterium]
MSRPLHLPPDGITALDRLNALAAGVQPTPARPHFKAANDNKEGVDDVA